MNINKINNNIVKYYIIIRVEYCKLYYLMHCNEAKLVTVTAMGGGTNKLLKLFGLYTTLSIVCLQQAHCNQHVRGLTKLVKLINYN